MGTETGISPSVCRVPNCQSRRMTSLSTIFRISTSTSFLATRQTLQMERDASNSSTTTAYYADAESTTAYDSEDMTKCTSLSRRSASPSSYLSAIAASIMPRKMFPLPTGGHESLLCDNYPDHTSRKTGKALRLERQYSREQRMFRFSCMSYDQKIAEIERSLRWMRAHSRRV
ncbi:hypothetical protein DFH29DRAFT_918323 [Suillus ampliporus]|nr:hypothetical protein DFH29DRAFT_918323 [Suillus ampliporus]